MAKLPGDSLPVSKKQMQTVDSKSEKYRLRIKCYKKKSKLLLLLKPSVTEKTRALKAQKVQRRIPAWSWTMDISQPIQSRNPPNLIQSSKWLKRQIQNSVSQKICNSLPLHFAFAYHFPDWDPILLPFLRFFKKSLFLRTTFSLWDRILASRVYCLEQCFFVMVTSCDSVSFYWLRATG